MDYKSIFCLFSGIHSHQFLLLFRWHENHQYVGSCQTMQPGIAMHNCQVQIGSNQED
jgi:hypothetical protein